MENLINFSDSNLFDVDYDDDDDEGEDNSLDCNELFSQYRMECEKWLNVSPKNYSEDKEDYIDLLRKMVKDLLDQNECLVLNIMEIKKESANRINELRRNLENTAGRTEEVMLSLQSHELCLKNFVQQHCCECCACDMRLMEFKLCHGSYCDHHHHHQNGTSSSLSFSTPTIQSRCWSFGHLWNAIIHQASHWYANKEIITNKCLHNLSSETRFLNLVDLIDSKIHQIENENETLKKENQMIRELNSLLSCRNGPPLLLNDIINRSSSSTINNNLYHPNHRQQEQIPQQFSDSSISLSPPYYQKTSDSNNSSDIDLIDRKFFENDTLLGDHCSTTTVETTTNDGITTIMNTFFTNGGMSSTSRESFESCDCRHDNDSGCSTDLIPSQTDMHSLLALSDLDDDNNSGSSSSAGENGMDSNNINTNDVIEEQIIKDIIGSMTSTLTPKTTNNRIVAKKEKEDNNLQLLQENNTHLEIENLRNRVILAEKLIPKLYNKTLFYRNQRNLLLQQFRS